MSHTLPAMSRRLHAEAMAPDPRLVLWLRRTLVLGLLLVLALPWARGSNAWLGWMPLWLVGMPLSACLALHRFRLPAWSAPGRVAAHARHRRRGGQARRRAKVRAPRRLPRAA